MFNVSTVRLWAQLLPAHFVKASILNWRPIAFLEQVERGMWEVARFRAYLSHPIALLAGLQGEPLSPNFRLHGRK
ncbi:hypothetical protein B0H67DRAFT_595308 [Lasiosphaeris hirsuta]|uniref:Uncharacterized protein n=1 Tax=Lasiosphaeris hirsuta TaxID=260670 RepID=A0AA40DI57_9PEZI|nr:hypothetical protein B0H67DRAFT_595308 [Lasiosphaeris hirsuta]